MGKSAAIIATAAAVTALTAVPAHAEPVVIYQLSGTSRCLADIGTNVVLKTCDRTSEEQRWIVPNSDADWPHNLATGNCLAATTSGDVLGQSCGPGANQRWRRMPVTSTTFQFRNLGTAKCLTAQVAVAACTSTSPRWVGLR
jgi:hypothetical protein